MNRQVKNLLSIGFCFGCICYVICGYFLEGYFPVLMGIFTWCIFSLTFYLILLRNNKKHLKLIAGIEQETLIKDSINYYGQDGVSNGLLFLTREKLCFYEAEKKHKRYEYAIEEICGIEYGKKFRHIEGCIVTLQNGQTAKFGMTNTEFIKWMEMIKSIGCAQFGSAL